MPADSFAWNARKQTGPEKPSDLSTWPSIEEIGYPDGGRIKRVFPANLGQIRAPRLPAPPPRPPGQLRVRRRSADYRARPPAGHLHDKGAAGGPGGRGSAGGAWPGSAPAPPAGPQLPG